MDNGLDTEAFDRLARLLRYVDGDYNDAATFAALRSELGGSSAPVFYLAIPPALFGLVDLASARNLSRILLGANTPVYDYEPGTWGPSHATSSTTPPGGWHPPELTPSAPAHEIVRAA